MAQDNEYNRVCPECGRHISLNAVVCPSCGVQVRPVIFKSHNKKSRLTAVLLALFFGWFGVHWFYLNRTLYGVLSLIFSWTGVPAVISFISVIVIIVSGEDNFNNKYNTI